MDNKRHKETDSPILHKKFKSGDCQPNLIADNPSSSDVNTVQQVKEAPCDSKIRWLSQDDLHYLFLRENKSTNRSTNISCNVDLQQVPHIDLSQQEDEHHLIYEPLEDISPSIQETNLSQNLEEFMSELEDIEVASILSNCKQK